MNSYDDPKKQSRGRDWNLAEDTMIHDYVFEFVNHIDTDQGYKSANNLRNMRLYGNYDMTGLDQHSYTRAESSGKVNHRVTLNIIQSIVDTIVSKMSKNKPRPSFLTDGGDWSAQRKAKKLTKFCEGIFSSTNFYKQALIALKDSLIFGTGAVKIYKEKGNIKAERVFINEIIMDDTEAFYGEPRQIHQVKFIHESILCAMFPDFKHEIQKASNEATNNLAANPAEQNGMLRVVESWHLPSGDTMDKNGKEMKHDGKHAICINNATLYSKPYKKKYFPFVFYKWNEKPVGFWGLGMSEQLSGIQLEINKILRTIQVSMHLVSIPKLMVEASSKVVTAHLNNKIGGIIKYAGTAPQYQPLGGIPGELFTHLDRLYDRGYEISGMSQLSAQSQKPGGLDSGKALREYNDIESERFLESGQRYERTFIDAAKIMIDMAKDCYEDDNEYKVKVKGKSFIETIAWKDVSMEEDKFLMDVFPTSALSSTPSGRLQDIQELMTAGFIQKEDGIRLLDFPDLENSMNLLTAGVEDIHRMIEEMIDKGNYSTPEPYQNLEYGIKTMQQAYLKYRSEGAPDSRLELLRRWMEDAQALLTKASEGFAAPPPLPQESIPDTNTTPEVIAQAADSEAIAQQQAIAEAQAKLPV